MDECATIASWAKAIFDVVAAYPALLAFSFLLLYVLEGATLASRTHPVKIVEVFTNLYARKKINLKAIVKIFTSSTFSPADTSTNFLRLLSRSLTCGKRHEPPRGQPLGLLKSRQGFFFRMNGSPPLMYGSANKGYVNRGSCVSNT